MTASSTSTLIEVVNRVLLDVGERQVTTITSPAARKAQLYIQESLSELQHFHDWEWLYATITPNTWILDTVTLSNVQRIKYASWVNSVTSGLGWTRLSYLDAESFDATVAIRAFDSTINTAERPFYWTFTEYNTLRISPYPTNASGRSRVKVYVILDMVAPSVVTGVFPIPEYMIPVLRKLATAKMYQNHLSDTAGYQVQMQEFSQLLQQIRTRQAKNPVGGQLNMYKANRRY